MKTLLKIAGGIVIALIVLLLFLRVIGFEPHGGTPGLWLKGELVTAPVSDWSFTDQYQTIKVQTQTPFLLPHSVTTYCVAYQGQLYLTSVYKPGLTFPHGRSWNENVARDPYVRLKIGDKLYDRKLVLITDPVEKAPIIKRKAQKYPQQKIAPGSTINLFHVVTD